MLKSLLIDAFLPVAASILSIVVPSILGAVYVQWQKLTGIEIEAHQRQALQSALANAGRLLLDRTVTKDHAIDYVLASVPDALKGLKVDTRERIAELLVPHINGQAATVKPIMLANFPRDQPNGNF